MAARSPSSRSPEVQPVIMMAACGSSMRRVRHLVQSRPGLGSWECGRLTRALLCMERGLKSGRRRTRARPCASSSGNPIRQRRIQADGCRRKRADHASPRLGGGGWPILPGGDGHQRLVVDPWLEPGDRQDDRQVSLPDGQNIRTLSLAPDGKQLLIEYDQSAQAVLALVNLDGSSLRPLVSAPSTGSAHSFTVLWSADSSQLLIANPPGFSTEMFEQLDIASLKSNPVPVEEAGAGLSLLGWSPDQAWIAVQSLGSPPRPICLLNRQTGKMTPLSQEIPQSQLSLIGWILFPG